MLLKIYKAEQQNIESLHNLVKTYFETSFLFDSERLFLKKHDDHYNQFVSAVDIYNEFEKIDRELYKKNNYNISLMLELMKSLLGYRYNAFKNVYDRRYKTRPQMTTKEYLEYFNNAMQKITDKLEFGLYPKGFTSIEKDKVKNSLAETILYLRAIGKWKLADDVLQYFNPIQSPKLPKETIPELLKCHTADMVKKCGIKKNEAKSLLNNEVKKIITKK